MGSPNERLKLLRKCLKIKQSDFAKQISTTQGHISDIENNRKGISERTIKLICLESWNGMKINEHWLRTGEGGVEGMFLSPQNNDLVSKAIALLGERDPLFEVFVDTYSKLSPTNRKVLLDFGVNLLTALDLENEGRR